MLGRGIWILSEQCVSRIRAWNLDRIRSKTNETNATKFHWFEQVQKKISNARKKRNRYGEMNKTNQKLTYSKGKNNRTIIETCRKCRCKIFYSINTIITLFWLRLMHTQNTGKTNADNVDFNQAKKVSSGFLFW